MKIIIVTTAVLLIFTVILTLTSSCTNRVIQVSLQHDSVNVINGNKEVEVYGDKEYISFPLSGAINDTNVHSIKLSLLHKQKHKAVFTRPVNSKGIFTFPLQFGVDDLDNYKEYKFMLAIPNYGYIDTGSINLSVLAEVYGKNGVSALIIAALGTFAALLQIFQLFYPNMQKKNHKT